jgi:hypothetical protein
MTTFTPKVVKDKYLVRIKDGKHKISCEFKNSKEVFEVAMTFLAFALKMDVELKQENYHTPGDDEEPIETFATLITDALMEDERVLTTVAPLMKDQEVDDEDEDDEDDEDEEEEANNASDDD